MPKITRRQFLKLSAATAAGVAATNFAPCDGMFVHPDAVALAASDAPEEVKYTHCVMCNHGPRCGMKLIIKEGKVYRIEKRDGYPNNLLCAKGISSIQELYEPNRLLYPMKRTTPKGSDDPKWERITWDEALQTIAEKLNDIKAKYGAEKVMFMTGDPKEPRSAVQRLAFTFGSPNMGTESSTCYKGTELATKLLYGPEWFTASSMATGAGPTVGKTKVCIIWGNNPPWSSPFSYNGMKTGQEKKQCKYIVVDPRITPTVTQFADIHLQIRPGTDGALALCLANGLIQADAYDHDFVENWTHGFEEYAQYASEFTVKKTAEICQVPAETIQAAIDCLVTEGAPITCKSAAAFTHHTNGINNYRAIMSLIPLTGSVDVPGGLTIKDEPLNFDEWQMTFEFARSKDLLPKLDHLRVDRPYFPVWADTDQQGSVQLNRIPEYVETGAIRAAVMFGTNAMMWPQTHLYQEAFAKMDFCVAADFYIRPWTHNYVDMVLPAAMSWERSCPLTVFGRKIFLREPVVEPAGECRSDYRIACDIGTALGYADEFWGGGEKSEENCIREALRTLDVDTPITYEDLKAASPNPIEIPLRGEPKTKKYELGLLREDGKPGFTTPTGKVEFVSEILREHGFDPLPIYVDPVYSPNTTPDVYEKYPLIMNSGSRVPMYTHSKERELPWLNQFMPEPIVRLNPKDAEERGLAEGDTVRVFNQFGELTCKLEISKIIKEGVIDMFHGWSQANINELISRDFDPISGFPPFKEGLCQVEKA
ncbi:MAG: molybdopterin-dependent oxidoreductase [Lachnospiraceae bacterium]|nr:molybdopterin-dependent oxidoreductase [Lachnospiraceae bacterium]